MNVRNSANGITNFPEVLRQVVDNPAGKPVRQEIGIIREHRFAFYFWSRWVIQKLNGNQSGVPALITIDWHQDLAPPNEQERDELDRLNLIDDNEVFEFCRMRMNPYNDGHILSAAWLELIGDIMVICKQRFRSLEHFVDRSGGMHNIRKYTGFEEARKELERNEHIILDIDLDYFTESESFRGGDPDVRLDPDEEIRLVLDPYSDFFQSVFKRFHGMTIATEPGFCGNIENAHHILAILNEQFFDAPLTDPKCNWRHLAER